MTFTVEASGDLLIHSPGWDRALALGLRTDPADADALRASYARTVAVVGRGPGVQPIPARLPKSLGTGGINHP